MRSFRPKLWTAAGVAVLAGGLAACGGSDVMKEEPTPLPPTATEPAPPQTPTATPGATPAVQGGERGGEHGAEAGDDHGGEQGGEGGNRGPG